MLDCTSRDRPRSPKRTRLLLATAEVTGAASAVLAPALQAGFQGIVSRAAVSLDNNKGDVGKILKELGSSNAIKSVATSMVTARLVAALV